jgi:hypothetical protein
MTIHCTKNILIQGKTQQLLLLGEGKRERERDSESKELGKEPSKKNV